MAYRTRVAALQINPCGRAAPWSIGSLGELNKGSSYEGAINPELTKIDGIWSQDGGGAALIFSRAGVASKGK